MKTPSEILALLQENSDYLTAIADKIKESRNDLILKQSALFDCEQEARSGIFSGQVVVQASKIRDYIKFKTSSYEKDFEISKQRVKILCEERDILIETNNNLKAQLRIMEMEMRYLSLPAHETETGKMGFSSSLQENLSGDIRGTEQNMRKVLPVHLGGKVAQFPPHYRPATQLPQ